MEDAVIGRERIDNYLMSLVTLHKGYLIDSTFRSILLYCDLIIVTAVHLGSKCYLDKQHKTNQMRDDILWNHQFSKSIHGMKGSLYYSKWKPKSSRRIV